MRRGEALNLTERTQSQIFSWTGDAGKRSRDGEKRMNGETKEWTGHVFAVCVEQT